MYDINMIVRTTEIVAAGQRAVNMSTVTLSGEVGRL